MPKLPAVPDRQRRAYELDACIAHGMRKTIQSILEMGAAFKEVRDDKLYVELGYEDFEAYTVEHCQLARRTANNYIEIIEKLPEEFRRRVARLDNPPSFRRLIALPNDTAALSDSSVADIEALRDMSDADFDKYLAKIKGYDRERDGGRGPSDVERPSISRDRYRDQSRKVLLLKEKLESATGEREELVRLIKQLQETVAKQNEILSSDDRTRVAHLQIQQQSDIIASYHTAERKTIAQKVDREAAIRLITELRFHILARLRDFRDAVHLPDLETAAWFGVTFDDIRMDVQQVYDFVASDALKEFSETGAPVPLADAAAALGTLTKSIRANLTKLDIEAGRVQVVGKPPKK